MIGNNGRVYWLIWDGAPYWVIKNLLEEGSLPNLQYIIREGFLSPMLPPQYNCQTPPSLASLFTGKTIIDHQIYSYFIPSLQTESNILNMKSGFQTSLPFSPIWESIGGLGKTSSLVSIPWVNRPFDCCNFILDGYGQRYARRGIHPLKLSGQDSFLIGSYVFKYRWDGSGLSVSREDDTPIILHQDSVSTLYKLGDGKGIVFYLSENGENEPVLVHSGIWSTYINHFPANEDIIKFLGAFNGESHGADYRKGSFGIPIIRGGDGTAENRFMVSIHNQARYFIRASEYAMNLYPNTDFTLLYQPCTDDIGHEMVGICDQKSSVYNKNESAMLWPFVRETYSIADKHLSCIRKHLRPEDMVIICSDHGMAGNQYQIFVNEVFYNMGLLSFNDNGTIKLDKTKILYHPSENGMVIVNLNTYQEGIVGAHGARVLLKRVTEELLKLVNKETGYSVIEKILPLCDIVKAKTGLFLVPKDGYGLSASRSMQNNWILPASKQTIHSIHTNTDSLKGFIACNKKNGKSIDYRNEDLSKLILNYFH